MDTPFAFSLCDVVKLSTTGISFSAETLGTDDHRCGRTARKLAVPSLFSRFLRAQKSEKRLLEGTRSARCVDEGSAYLTGRDHRREERGAGFAPDADQL